MASAAALALGALVRFQSPADGAALAAELCAASADRRSDGGLRSAHAAALGALCRAAPLSLLLEKREALVAAVEACAADEGEVRAPRGEVASAACARMPPSVKGPS